MKTVMTILIGSALALGVAACDRSQSPVRPTMAAAAATTDGTTQTASLKSPFVSFTKIPSAFADQTITPGPDVRLMVFQIDGTHAKDIAVTQLQFMIFGGMLDGSGPLPSGYLTNFRLLYFPKGLDGASTEIGVNDGLTWTPGFTPDTFLRIDVTPAFALKNNFVGVFALVADVTGAPARFQPHLQVAMVTMGGVEQPLVNPGTCDLPLAGDGFVVN